MEGSSFISKSRCIISKILLRFHFGSKKYHWRISMTESVKIEKMVYGGDGLGRLSDGRAVFVPFVLPGEVVSVELNEEKARFARGTALHWHQNSPHRIPARCKYFTVCGSCHYQHMPYQNQLETKLEAVRDQLSRIAGIDSRVLSHITHSDQNWHYRNQIQCHVTQDGELGFMRADNAGILPIKHCEIAMPGLNTLLDTIILEPESGIKRVTFREDSDGECFVLLEGDEALPPELTVELEVSAGYMDSKQNYHHLAGIDQLHYQILDKDFTVSPGSFFQVNNAVSEKLVKHVIDLAKDIAPHKVLELYSGAGLFSAFLAPMVSQLIAIESTPSACYDFANNLDAFDNVSLYEGSVEAILPNLLPLLKPEPPDLVLLDPPRAGLHIKALDALAELAPKNIIYVSCDPSTLARDLKRLGGKGYQVETIHALDMFAQTYHIETVVLLSRK
jgi:23S rRNA (uracil1939-C5)-methyltransferase